MFKVENLIKYSMFAFFCLLLVLQFLSFPGQFRYLAEQEPENAHLRWPLTALTFLIILAVQICVICMWKLISNLFTNGELSARLRYVNLSIGALSFIWAVIAIALVILLINADDPGLPVVITVIQSGVTIVLMLYLAYRKLLRKSFLLKKVV